MDKFTETDFVELEVKLTRDLQDWQNGLLPEDQVIYRIQGALLNAGILSETVIKF